MFSVVKGQSRGSEISFKYPTKDCSPFAPGGSYWMVPVRNYLYLLKSPLIGFSKLRI